LLKREIEVLLILRKNSDCWRIHSLLPTCKIIYSDISNIDEYQNDIIQFQPDALIHSAWIGVTNDKRNHILQVNENIECVLKLFSVLQKAQVKTIIGLGSQAEYGPLNHIINEHQVTTPTTLYGVSKLACYHTLNVLCQQNNIRFVWHRLFSSYGPRDHESWFIPYLIKQLINGNEPELTLGGQLWDYIFIDDAAEAIVQSLINHKGKGIYNLGSGQVISIRELAEKLRFKINSKLQLGFGKVPYRDDQVMFLQADIAKLQSDLGWCPKISLDEGLDQTIEWFSQYEYLANE
jgi:nucleoside-diphosphate-sugar epimerase